jgi:ABC-2 type transport system ATP-binding protein
VIEVDGLSFKYVGRRQPTLRNITLSIPDGQSVLVLGPSGCGKSTLALCLNGAVPHAIEGDLHGSVRVDGLDTRRASMADLAQRVGIVFQDPEAQFCMLSVEDEVAFGLANLAVPRREMDARIDEALAMVGLAGRRRERIGRLSGGQKQRLALACVLAQEPSVLVLDEPTTGLDAEGRRGTWELVRALRDGGTTVLLTTHYLEEAEGLADRLAILHEGRIAATGTPAEVTAARPSRISFRLPDGYFLGDLPPLGELGVCGHEVDGDLVRLRTRELQRAATGLLVWAERARVELGGLDVRSASLEEAFLGIARNQEVAA